MNEIVVILNDIRSTHNVGSILRSCDGFGVKRVFFCGYTPYPTIDNDTRLPHERAKIDRAIHKTALGAEKTIALVTGMHIEAVINTLKLDGFTIAALEQAESSTPLSDFKTPQKIAIILGNEVSGVNTTILEACDVILEIPMNGTKESFNVAVAGAICLYELTK